MHGQLERAVENNARWCDTVYRTHGMPGEFAEALWLNRHGSLPFYPNAVTLTRQGAVAQLATLQTLIEAGLSGEWGVKDSFATLDLTALGFRPLFEATWIWRAATLPPPLVDQPGVRWATVTSEDELARWEVAWRGAPAEAVAPGDRLFRPALLAEADVRLIAAYSGESIVAGAIGSRTGDVVGLSNVFTPYDNAPHFWAGAIATMMRAFPGLPLVGYEAGEELDQAQAAGFTPLGPLRIWLRTKADESTHE
jgi:hypothetical protein